MLPVAPFRILTRPTLHCALHRTIRFAFGFLALSTWSAGVAAQNIQDTKNKPDQTLRADARVDPATHGLSLQIPLGTYPGRAGLNLPLAITYSSKLWRLEYDGNGDQHNAPHTRVRAVFAEETVAGWTSSFKAPTIDINSPGYDLTSVNYGQEGGPPGFTGAIARIHIRLPDGSSHELRKDDVPHNSASTPADFHFSGSYFAVDGSRLRFDFATPSSGTLYLPDGARYIFEPPPPGELMLATQYIDRNGNKLVYNRTMKEWTDTLGRVLKDPLSLFPNGGQSLSVGDTTYTLPGVSGSQQTYTFQWRNLGYTDPQTNESVLTVAGPLYYLGDRDCDDPALPVRSPSLFQSLSTVGLTRVCAEVPFNPIVLSKIILPDGTAYRFSYNVFGEIDKIYLPTGGYERYLYPTNLLQPMTYLKQPYRQMNRGVIERRVSADGTAASESVWQYGIEYTANSGGPYSTTTIAPDGTLTRQYWHAHPNFFGDNPTLVAPFGMEDARTGRAYEEQVFAPAAQGGAMLRRKLTEWTYTGPTTTDGYAGATRDARVAKEVAIVLDTSGPAPTTTTTYEYDADLNVKAVNHYDFVLVDQQTAQTASLTSGAFTPVTLLRRDETDYLTDNQAYRARNLTALPRATRVKDGAGRIVAQTQMRYDETALTVYGPLIGWSDPGTTARGNLTTASKWLNTTGTWLEARIEYDQCGSVVKSIDARGQVAQTEYGSEYARAYPTHTISPVPDPSGFYGAGQPA